MSEVSQNEINELISDLAPHNNRYREIVNNPNSGKEVLQAMWLAGDILVRFTGEHEIKPHNLYWKVYGKAEGIKNSYITRDFLSYCLRIRNLFDAQSDINYQFPNLNKYSTFREAMPLLENPKFKLPKEELAELITLVNSSKNPAEIKKKLVAIKQNKIGRKNPRTQRLSEMEPFVEHFVRFYDKVFALIKNGQQNEIDEFRTSFRNNEDIEKLARSTMSLNQEGLSYFEVEVLPNDQTVVEYATDLITLHSKDVDLRSRYRRLVPASKLFKLSEMLSAIKDDISLTRFRSSNFIES